MNDSESESNCNTAFESSVSESWPFEKWANYRVVVAVSGGADSVALLLALCSICKNHSCDPAERIVVGHVDHGVRENSAEDAEFVAELSDRLGLEFRCEKLEPIQVPSTGNKGMGYEGVLRQQRYDRLLSIAEQFEARFVALAHHFDDQVETVLQRFFRGTSVSGLRGIPFSRAMNEFVSIVRPMISIRRFQVEHYLDQLGQSFRQDESNFENTINRNRVRNELIPLLRQDYSNDLYGSMASLVESANEHHDFVESLVDPLMEFVGMDDSGFAIELNAMPMTDRVLVTRVIVRAWTQCEFPLRDMNRQKWNSLFEMMQKGNSTASTMYPGGIQVANDGLRLVARRKNLPLA